VLFQDDFGDGDLAGWRADRPGAWSVRRGVLRADLPDQKQLHSFLYAGDEWTEYALDLDLCGMRGVDKGVVVRVTRDGKSGEANAGIGVDLRGPPYHDILLHRGPWPLGKARVVNPNVVWHHLRIEARGHRYRVWVDRRLVLDRKDGRRASPAGGIALAAYTGGAGQCTIYFDNVLVTALSGDPAAATAEP
jgi:hypothetical protein